MEPFITRHEIDTIISLDGEPVLRNLRITQRYHDLSASFASVMGGENANWCTFAAWASKTAGRFIRGEPAAIFRDALQNNRRLAGKLDRLNTLLRRLDRVTRFSRLAIVNAIMAPVEEMSRHITAGNLAVFAELGPLFSVMRARFDEARSYDPAVFGRLLDELGLKIGASEQGGQGLLLSATKHFFQAAFERQVDRKAELILLANSETGLHEQVRLQPAIAGALNLPFDASIQRLLEKSIAATHGGRLRITALNAARPLIDDMHRELGRIWRECATRLFMTMGLPDGEIHLGRDVRQLPGGEPFPPALRTIEDEGLRVLLRTYDADGWSAAQSGAADWADIRERMQFILTLFRARQQDRRLFEQPFSTTQRSEIEHGRVPQGAL